MDVPNNQMPSFPEQEIEATDSEVAKSPVPLITVSEDKPTPEVILDPPKGSQTPDKNLYAALEQERQLRREESQKRKELEKKLKEIELSSALSELDESELSEEGKALKQQLTSVNKKLVDIEHERDRERVFAKYPQLQDKRDEFEEFSSSKYHLSVEEAAKLFLVENDLLVASPARKGLERGTSGPREAPQPPGFTPEEIEGLRINQPKRFSKMLRDGVFDQYMN